MYMMIKPRNGRHTKYIYMCVCILHTQTHTHTHIYIYIYTLPPSGPPIPHTPDDDQVRMLAEMHMLSSNLIITLNNVHDNTTLIISFSLLYNYAFT